MISSFEHRCPGLAYWLNRIPFSRDQTMLLLVAINEIFLGLDTYLAHRISGTLVPREWIPVIFGPIAGALLLIAGLIALRRRNLASVLATLTLLASVAVGFIGSYFHFIRGTAPAAPPGQRVTISLLVWAPPVLGPMAFSLIGWLGISAAWIEDPPGSGNLSVPVWGRLELPFSKTRAYFFMVGLGTLMAVISSVLDHARHHFADPWMWISTGVGIFGTVVPVLLGMIEKPSRGDLLTYLGGMILLLLMGPLGLYFHVMANLTAGGQIVIERFIRGAPFMAPMLFSNMGLLGIIMLMDPTEEMSMGSGGN